MSKHTLGPWCINLKDPFSIQQVAGIGPLATTYQSVPNNRRLPKREEALANARLIAAAPELKEALEDLLVATIDDDLKYGIALTEAEEEARAKALKVLGKIQGECPHA